MGKSFKYLFIFSLTAFVPAVVFAQANIFSVLGTIGNFFGAVLPVLVAFGVLYFVFGVVQYFIADDEEAKTKGKDRIIFGIIGLAVIISIWGLVYILTSTFGLGQGGQSAPSLQNLVTGGSAVSGGTCILTNNSPKFQDLVVYILCVIGDFIIPLLFALAVLMFIWGAIKFLIIDANEDEKREQGKQFMIWGIVALAVMISIWGIVGILGQTFNINTNVLPQVKLPQSTP